MTAQLLDILNTPAGPIQGTCIGQVKRWQGIPYATAERFRVPTPVEAWTEPFKAIEPIPACPQPDDPLAEVLLEIPLVQGLSISEHCQSLTITAPAELDPEEKLPVMVYFHGGAFVWGAADAAIYDPTRLVTENQVIVVNVGSRLGVFGYLGDGSASRPANLGLLDVMESLRWIKKNIGAFGGNDDASSITIFGQSAGGSTVSDVMASTEATSLFGRIIVQSAPFGITRGRDAMNKTLFKDVQDASAALSDEEIVKLTLKVISTGRAHGNMGAMPFAPQYGFAPLPTEKDLESTLDASAPQLDVLVGHTAEEALMFVDLIPALAKASKLPMIGNFMRRTLASYVTSMMYTKGALGFAQRHAKAGGKASYYKITWGAKDPKWGSMHACELPLLFGKEKDWAGTTLLKGYTWEEINEDGRKLRKIWADFAKGRQVDVQDSVEGLIEIKKY